MAQTTQAMPSGKGRKGAADGVNSAADEAEGSAYPNPHTGKKPEGFAGGQSEKGYFGAGSLGGEAVGDQQPGLHDEAATDRGDAD